MSREHLYTPRPSVLTELGAARELARLPGMWRRLRALPRGHATVLVAPGFMTGDAVTVVLRRALRALGHDARGWGLGKNDGDVWSLVPAFAERVAQARRATGAPVHLIGWSLGGYIAREAARDLPGDVAQVITMASPVIGGPKYTAAAGYYARHFGVDLDELEAEIAARDAVPLGVPVTALYSPSDQVVCPAACIDHVNEGVNHVALDCAHAGFGFSEDALEVIAAALAGR